MDIQMAESIVWIIFAIGIVRLLGNHFSATRNNSSRRRSGRRK